METDAWIDHSATGGFAQRHEADLFGDKREQHQSRTLAITFPRGGLRI
jgi:hypothetical protein